MGLRYEGSLTEQIVQFVQAHPGCVRADILTVLPPDTKKGSVSCLMRRMDVQGVLENRGGSGKSARWYFVEWANPKRPEYQHIAEDLLAGLKEIHGTKQADYLARRLEVIFGG